MLQDTPRTDAVRDAESLEDLVYRPQLALGNRQIRGANPLIAVPVTLLGYLALGFLGWKLVQHSRNLLTEIPKTIAVDLLAMSEGDAVPQAVAPVLAPIHAPVEPEGGTAAGGPPPGAIERPDATPPQLPANLDAVPEKPPTALPTQDLSGTAFPTRPSGGSSETGTGLGPGTEGTGDGRGTGNSGTGPGPEVVDFDFSDVEVIYEPKPTSANYPRNAKSAGIQGTVKVEIIVGTDGAPASSRAVEGPSMLRASAEDIAMKCRFKPKTQNGVPVLARFIVKVTFRLSH